jgi:hypothetical protein
MICLPATPPVDSSIPNDKENSPKSLNFDANEMVDINDASAICHLMTDTKPRLQELDAIIAAIANNHNVSDDLCGLLERSFS